MASSVDKEPLVKGGHIQFPGKQPSTFISSTVPCVYENTIILAATHPSITNADPTEDGWFISDFYAFNYLLKGQGQEQKWLTAADPEKLVRKYGSYLHGNPYEERRTCLDREMLDRNQLTAVTVVRPSDMIHRFLSEAKRASELAKRTQAPLLLLIFCHGLPNYHLCLDDGNRSKDLSILSLKGVLEPGARITLVTTACYSGGWATTPDLNATTMAAAGGSNDLGLGLSNAWSPSQSIGRTCGSIFASTIFQTLSSVTSPLLDPRLSSQSSDQETLQPDEPTEQQTHTYNSFCRSVLDTCQNKVTRFGSSQCFTFSAQDDAWEYSWTGRTGIPLAYFQDRWDALKIHPYTGPEDVRALRNTDPSNPTFAIRDPNQTGGDQNIIETMTNHIAHGRVKEMARIFHNTCPGDWTQAPQVALSGTLFVFYQLDRKLERAGWIQSVIRFRWEAALLADFIVEIFSLPVPRHEICILWDWRSWQHEIQKSASLSWSELKERASPIYSALGDSFNLPCLEQQGPPFNRPLDYLAAALVEADKPNDETTAIIDDIGELLKDARAFQNQRVYEDPEVQRTGREWLKSIGRRARKSLSPRKRASTTESVSC
jgi:hypothetical protein